MKALKNILILFLISISTFGQSQIPKIILQKVDSFLIDRVGEEDFNQYFAYNCSSSYMSFMGNIKWYSCEVPHETPFPELAEYHALNLFEKYHIYYNFKNAGGLKDFFYILADNKGNFITHSELLMDKTLDQYQNLKLSEQNAVNIAYKNKFPAGLKTWEIELLCTKFNYQDYIPTLDDEMFLWSIKNCTDLGDGCNQNGLQIFISAENGEIIHETTWYTRCIYD